MGALAGILMGSWNSFSAPCIFAAYFASLPLDSDGRRYPWTFMGFGLLIGAGVLGCWWLTRLQRIYEVNSTLGVAMQVLWEASSMGHSILQCSMDVCMFLVLSQEITRSRDSPMYVPSEYIYVVPLLCILFVVPSVAIRRGPRAADRAVSMVFYPLVAVLGASSLCVIGAYTPEPFDTSRRIGLGQAMWAFAGMLILHFSPAQGGELIAPGQSKYRVAVESVAVFCIKGAALVLAIVCMTYKPLPPPKSYTGVHLHDYYLIRSLTQRDESPPMPGPVADPQQPHGYSVLRSLAHGGGEPLVVPVADPRPAPIYADLPAGKVACSILLKVYSVLSASAWFTSVQGILDGWMEALAVDKSAHSADLHELTLGGCVLAIVVGSFASSRDHMVYAGVSSAEHAVGPMWAAVGTAMLVALVAAVYTAELLIKRGAGRGEWIVGAG